MLVTSDLHLTDKQLDEYRFGIFPWLAKKARKLNTDAVFILGDLTDLKDHHSSNLVNRIIDELLVLARSGVSVHINMGNHDNRDPETPFFRFSRELDDIHFYWHVTRTTIKADGSDLDVLFLPHTRIPEQDWKGLDLNRPDFIFMHQTLTGAKASNGMQMQGISPRLFRDTSAMVFSGDIHVPQKVGKVLYVGAPYQIRFGDTYKPRILSFDEYHISAQPLRFPAPRKKTVSVRHPDVLAEYNGLREGDHVRVRLRVIRSQFTDWPNLREQVVRICKKRGLHLFSVEIEERIRTQLGSDTDRTKLTTTQRRTPTQVIEAFCTVNNIDKHTFDKGLELVQMT